MQLAGATCRVCERPIGGRTDGAICPDCGRPVHVACGVPPAGPAPGRCGRCNSPLGRRVEPVELDRAERKAAAIRAFGRKKVVGGGVLAAAGLVGSFLTLAATKGERVEVFGGVMGIGLLFALSGVADLRKTAND